MSRTKGEIKRVRERRKEARMPQCRTRAKAKKGAAYGRAPPSGTRTPLARGKGEESQDMKSTS